MVEEWRRATGGWICGRCSPRRLRLRARVGRRLLVRPFRKRANAATSRSRCAFPRCTRACRVRAAPTRTPAPPTVPWADAPAPSRAQALSPINDVFSDPESPSDCSPAERADHSPEASMTDGANGDASLLMLLLEASHEIEPKTDPEPFTPVESTLPPSVVGFQAPTPGTRNHTQELLAGRGPSATAGLPPRAAWSSPLVNDRSSASLPPHTSLSCSARLSRCLACSAPYPRASAADGSLSARRFRDRENTGRRDRAVGWHFASRVVGIDRVGGSVQHQGVRFAEESCPSCAPETSPGAEVGGAPVRPTVGETADWATRRGRARRGVPPR